jgi:hypothetical protein
MMTQIEVTSGIWQISLSTEALESLGGAALNRIVTETGGSAFFFDLETPQYDERCSTAFRHIQALKGPGMLVIGESGLPLFFNRASWEIMGGFNYESGQGVFREFLLRARKLRRFPVIQIG